MCGHQNLPMFPLRSGRVVHLQVICLAVTFQDSVWLLAQTTFTEYQNEIKNEQYVLLVIIHGKSYVNIQNQLHGYPWMHTITHLYIRKGRITEIINLSGNCNTWSGTAWTRITGREEGYNLRNYYYSQKEINFLSSYQEVVSGHHYCHACVGTIIC
jgi:hypothetical protein